MFFVVSRTEGRQQRKVDRETLRSETVGGRSDGEVSWITKVEFEFGRRVIVSGGGGGGGGRCGCRRGEWRG